MSTRNRREADRCDHEGSWSSPEK